MLVTKKQGEKRKLDSDKNKLRIYHPINDKSNLLALKPGYIIYPSAAQIFERKFMVKDLIIRNEATSVFWKGHVDLRNLKAPLKQTVDLGTYHIQVYPSDRDKPLAGRQLNKTCFVTFSKFPRINARKLKSVCLQNNCQIITIDQANRCFTVQIPHFTKYNFNEALQMDPIDDQPQIEQQENQKKQPKNLLMQLKQKVERSVLEQRQKLRQAPQPQISQKFKSLLPSSDLKNEVTIHNKRQGHQFTNLPGCGSEGQAYTLGVNGIVNSYMDATCRHFIRLEKTPNNKYDTINMIINLCKNQAQINDYILSQNTKMQIKRALMLYLICFNIHKCQFCFERRGQKIVIAKSKNNPEQYHRASYLKDWLEWVINQNPNIAKNQNQFIKDLCLRKTGQLAHKSLEYNKFEDAQFLGSIQDKFYRQSQIPNNLRSQLIAIKMGKFNNFIQLPWIVRFGVYMWYYHDLCFNMEIQPELIIRKNIRENYGYSLQRQIILSFLSTRFFPELTVDVKDQQMPLWWYISNKNSEHDRLINLQAQRQKKVVYQVNEKDANNPFLSNAAVLYNQFRLNLLTQLIDQYPDYQTVLNLISYQIYLDKEQKLNILGFFFKKFPQQAEKIALTEWEDYSNLVNQHKAYQCYANQQYIKCLQHFSKCSNLSKTSQQIIKQVSVKQQIISGFHQRTIEKVAKLMQDIKKNANIQILDDQIMYLNSILGRQDLRKQKVEAMIDMCYYKVPNYMMRKRMLQNIFKIMMKSNNIVLALKKDAQFENRIYSYYIDPVYRLQIKLTKLES